jgi:hypothetical protein
VAAYDWSVWQSSASATAWASASGGGITALAQAPTAPVREEKGNKKVKADNRGLPNCLLNQPEELPYGLVPIFVYVPVDPINAALLSVTITPLNNAPAGGLTKVANVFQQGQVPSEYNFGNGPCNVHNRAIAFQLEASKGGAYSVDVAYNGMLVKHGSFTCRVYEGKMTFDATVGPVVIPPTSRYVLPMNELGANNQLGALVATAILGQPLAMPLADYKARLFLMGGAAAIRIETSSGQQFISSVATPGSTLNAPATGVTGIKSVNLSATLEAEGSLKRNATYGRYRIKDAKRTINKVRCNMPCTQELSEVPGVAAPLTCDANLDTIEIVCPNVRIQSPTGDPTAAAGATGANADNEAVFDDQVPQGEVAGTCRIDAEGRVLSGLSAATSASIWSMLEWHIDNAGAIAAVCTPVQNAVHKQTIVYPGMPAVPTAFGPKKLRLRFRAAYNRPSWRCEQPMELFFARNGVSASSVQGVPAYVTAGSPNWLCYWTQIYPLTKGGGNPGITLAAGADSEHTLQFQTVTDPATGKLISQSLLGSSITIRAAHADSLSAFVGIFAHEQTHENDFFDVIWGGGGYAVAQDRDFDFLKDDWERTQPMLPPWSFDVPAYGNLLAMPGNNPAEDHSAWGESTVKYAAWSDVRADVAAKNAVNANLGIDASDWSDSTVASGVPHSFGDNDRPASETQTANPTTSGNHKGFHP